MLNIVTNILQDDFFFLIQVAAGQAAAAAVVNKPSNSAALSQAVQSIVASQQNLPQLVTTVLPQQSMASIANISQLLPSKYTVYNFLQDLFPIFECLLQNGKK